MRAFFSTSRFTGINDVASMRGFVIGAKDGSACAAWLEERGIKTLRRFPTSDARGGSSAHPRCSSVLHGPDGGPVLHLQAEPRRPVPPDRAVVRGGLPLAVAKGRTELRDFIQRGFERVSASELRDIENRWIGTPVRPPLDRHYLVYRPEPLRAYPRRGCAASSRGTRAQPARFGENRRAAQRPGSVQMHEQRFGQMFRLSPDATVVTSIADGKVDRGETRPFAT